MLMGADIVSDERKAKAHEYFWDDCTAQGGGRDAPPQWDFVDVFIQ